MNCEIYMPDEQIIINDINLHNIINEKKIIEKSLLKKFVVSDLDRMKNMDELLKIDIAFAIGFLFGSGKYDGMGSEDSTWLYEFDRDNCSYGGVAIVRDGKVIEFYPIWQKLKNN